MATTPGVKNPTGRPMPDPGVQQPGKSQVGTTLGNPPPALGGKVYFPITGAAPIDAGQLTKQPQKPPVRVLNVSKGNLG